MKSHILNGLASLTIILFMNHGSAERLEKYRQFQIEGLAVSLTLERHAENVERIDWPESRGVGTSRENAGEMPQIELSQPSPTKVFRLSRGMS